MPVRMLSGALINARKTIFGFYSSGTIFNLIFVVFRYLYPKLVVWFSDCCDKDKNLTWERNWLFLTFHEVIKLFS